MRLSPFWRGKLEATALALSYLAVLSLGGGLILAALEWNRRRSPDLIFGGLFLFLACVVCRFTCNAVLDRAEGNRIRQRDRCPRCGYDLRGLSRNAACPECGCGSGHRM